MLRACTRWLLACAALLGGALGCQTDGGPPAFGHAGGPAAGVEEDVWAVRCITVPGPERQVRAESYATALKRVPGLKPELVQIVNDEDGTAVFYGRYRRVYGVGAEADTYQPHHLRDLELIRSLRLETGDVWPFILATMDVLPTYRSGHPEWDLTDQEAFWSLQVAVFYNTDEFHSRRSAAEEYCRLLRESGEDAYYHHGPANSSVCVGLYPFEAVAEVRQENALAGRTTTRMAIVDAKMLAAQKRYPCNLENGHRMYDIVRDARTGDVKERAPRPSFPVILPKAQRRPGLDGGP